MIYFIDNLPKRFKSVNFDEMILFAHDFLSLQDDLHLEIEFIDLPKHMHGEADFEDDVATISLQKRIKLSDLIPTIFHEMVHIKQIVEGDLVVGADGSRAKWKGEHVQCEYYDFPWEVEAFQLEEKMMKLFKTDS